MKKYIIFTILYSIILLFSNSCTSDKETINLISINYSKGDNVEFLDNDVTKFINIELSEIQKEDIKIKFNSINNEQIEFKNTYVIIPAGETKTKTSFKILCNKFEYNSTSTIIINCETTSPLIDNKEVPIIYNIIRTPEIIPTHKITCTQDAESVDTSTGSNLISFTFIMNKAFKKDIQIFPEYDKKEYKIENDEEGFPKGISWSPYPLILKKGSKKLVVTILGDKGTKGSLGFIFKVKEKLIKLDSKTHIIKFTSK